MFEVQPFHPDRPDLVAPVRVDPRGVRGPTRKAVRGPRWRRTGHGLYVPSAVKRTVEQDIVEAAALLRPGDAVTGWASLRWRRARWTTGERGGERLPVPVVTTHFLASRPTMVVSQEHLRHQEVEVVDGLAITSPLRSVCLEVRRAATLLDAVVLLDMAAYDDLVALEELAAYVHTIGPWTGVEQARAALRDADENSWSPMETVMRDVWVRAGYPRPLCNVPLFDLAGRHLATPDLLDPVAGVVGEYDSDLHLVGARRTKDVRREGVLRHAGLEYVVMLGSDRSDDHASFRQRLDTAYARSCDAGRPRGWTVERPRWWVDTTTVAARRGLSGRQRARLLAHRKAV